jgi:hypothetical protein
MRAGARLTEEDAMPKPKTELEGACKRCGDGD